MRFKRIRCLICNSDHGTVIIEREFPRHEICQNCGFVYMNPILDSSDNKKFYEGDYWNEHHDLTGVKKEYQESERQKRMHSWMQPFFKERSNLLEIGCGYGFNLDFLKQRNSQLSVEGLEVSKEACYNVGKAFDIPCHNSTIEEFQTEKKYNCVVMCHVLEHFEQPESVLSKTHSLLKENGIVWIEVPNIMFPNPTKDISKWLAKEHISYFSPEKLKFLLEKTGFLIKREEHKHYVCFLAEKVDINEDSEHIVYSNEFDLVKKAITRQKKYYRRYRLFRKLRLPSFLNYRLR